MASALLRDPRVAELNRLHVLEAQQMRAVDAAYDAVRQHVNYEPMVFDGTGELVTPEQRRQYPGLERLEQRYYEAGAEHNRVCEARARVAAELSMSELLAVWRYMKMLHYDKKETVYFARAACIRFDKLEAVVNDLYVRRRDAAVLASYDFGDMLRELDAFESFILENAYNARLWEPFRTPDHMARTRARIAVLVEEANAAHEAHEARALATMFPDPHDPTRPSWLADLDDPLRDAIVRQTKVPTRAWR